VHHFAKFAAYVATLAILVGTMSSPDVSAKTWTVDERQAQLMQDINKGQKSKELTVKECTKLRSDLADVARKKKKALAKNKQKLTPADITVLEEDLNKISVAITKLKLEKRTQVLGK
jgi:hypothetical protein